MLRTCQGGYMLRRSVLSGTRRLLALPRYCAPIAIAFVFAAITLAAEQFPALQATNPPEQTKTDQPVLPAPERPAPSNVLAPAAKPDLGTPPQTPPAAPLQQPKRRDSKTPKPTEDLGKALITPGSLNFHGMSLDKA